jgi:hypothetical protein
MRGLPHFFFRPTDDASRLSLLRQNAQIKGVVRNCVIRRLPLIPLLRLAILCAEPQATEFQQQEPLRAEETHSNKQRRSSAKKRRHQDRSLVDGSA